MYNPTISLEENLKIFEDNGLKISGTTFFRWKKKLGIEKHNDRIKNLFKSLYNPSKSMRENLKTFKDNGLNLSPGAFYKWKRKLFNDNNKNKDVVKEFSFPDQITKALKDLISKSREKVGLGGTIEIFKPIYDELISEKDKIDDLMRESTRQIQEHQKKVKEFESQLYGELFKNKEVD